MEKFLESRRAVVSFAIAFLLCLAGSPCGASGQDDDFGRDKAVHFSACFLIAADGYAVASLADPRTTTRVAAGASLALAAGAAKEVADRYSGGDPSLRDFAWDIVGAATGAMVSWLFDRYIF